MIAPEILEIWVRTRDKVSELNLQLKWEKINHRNVAVLYKQNSIIKTRPVDLGLYSILEDFIYEK